jgi:hypothetical protein
VGFQHGWQALTEVRENPKQEPKFKLPTSTRARQENGVSGGGLITVVHPAARAAPSLRVIIADGKFHGVNIELHAGQKQSKWFRSKMTYTTPFVRQIRI